MLKIKKIPVTPLEQNCRVIYDTDTKSAIVIDPGGDIFEIVSFVEEAGLNLKEIWLTHSHFDHCGGVKELKDKFNVPLRAHPIEKEMRKMVEDIARMYNLSSSGFKNCPEPEHNLSDNEVLSFEGHKFKCLFTPGHAPGHICFYYEKESTLIAGDTLFKGSIGRTDLPLGNHGELISSIKNKLYILPDNTKVMPGHGPDTIIGIEKSTNPFVRG